GCAPTPARAAADAWKPQWPARAATRVRRGATASRRDAVPQWGALVSALLILAPALQRWRARRLRRPHPRATRTSRTADGPGGQDVSPPAPFSSRGRRRRVGPDVRRVLGWLWRGLRLASPGPSRLAGHDAGSLRRR